MNRFLGYASKNSFYSSKAWRQLRIHQLTIEPVCRACTANGRVEAATDVDHIIPISEAPGLALEPANLQSLCFRCHTTKTREDNSRSATRQNKARKKGRILNKRYPV